MTDDRSKLISVMGADGPRRATEADLRNATSRWPLTGTTPPGVAEMLKTSRDLFCTATIHYDFFVVGVVWSLMAVEAALREHYAASHKARLVDLIHRAKAEDLLERV